jgi:hypothetical protein
MEPSMKVTMVALKPTRHRGRKLRKGESFEAEPRTARVFGALGRARLAAEAALNTGLPNAAPVAVANPPINSSAPAPVETAVDPLADLRAEFEGITGQVPDRRWGESRLRTEIRDRRDRRAAGEDPPDAERDAIEGAAETADKPGDLL